MIMRRIHKYAILLSIFWLVMSCSRDIGNYDYRDLDEPQITGFEDRSVLMFSRLVMTPGLGSDRFSGQDYSHEWKVVNRNADVAPVVIGTERELDYEVTLQPGSYVLYYTVSERRPAYIGRLRLNSL